MIHIKAYNNQNYIEYGLAFDKILIYMADHASGVPWLTRALSCGDRPSK